MTSKSPYHFTDFHRNQFGYKNKTSCKQAHYVVNEIINYYQQRGSKIYLISLDATKAFDRLWRDGLLYKLFLTQLKNFIVDIKFFLKTLEKQ